MVETLVHIFFHVYHTCAPLISDENLKKKPSSLVHFPSKINGCHCMKYIRTMEEILKKKKKYMAYPEENDQLISI